MLRLTGHFLFLILLSNFGFSEVESGVEESQIDPVLIQIRVISQLQNYPKSWTRAYLSPNNEFHYFSKAIKKCLKKVKGDYQFQFKRFPGKFDEQGFGILIYLHDWKSSSGGIIQAYFTARYEYRGEKGVLGSFTGETVQVVTPIRSVRDRSFEDAVIEAGRKFVRKLQPVLDHYFEEEGEGAEK